MKQRVDQYHESMTTLVHFLRELEEYDTKAAALMAAGDWLEAVKFLAEAKAAGGE